jgi:citrate lyase beta subunit
MAENTTQAGNATIAADDVATLNGAASSGVLVQRVKETYGDDGTARDVSDAFPLPVRRTTDTATLTSVAASVTSVTVIAANTNRRGLRLHAVTSSAVCYVRMGGGTAAAALGGHSFDMQPGALYEDPDGYTGAVTAIWATATGGLNVTELT